MVYIRQEQLPKLNEYRYSGVDNSLVSKYVLKPFYTHVAIKFFPLSMAPNAITLTGFSFVIVNVLTLLWYNPTLDQDCPPWVYISWAVGLFLYQTFDAIDGQQARRTKQGSPLGELFDHGVDACNTSLEVLLFAATMNLGQSWKTVLILFACLLTFYVQTWDEYHTKTLTLGLISGPVEGVLTLCFVFALTAFLGGGHFWEQSMLRTIGIAKPDWLPQWLYEFDWSMWFMGYGGVVLFYNIFESTRNVLQAKRARNEEPYIALAGYLPFLYQWTLVPIYLYLQPTILYQHLIPFIIYVGLINAYAVGRIIVAHLLQGPFPYHNILLLPLFCGVVDSAGPWLQNHIGIGWPSALGDGMYQVAFLFLSLGLAVGVYGSFVVDVIFAICDYLDIWCLTIKHVRVDSKTGKEIGKEKKKKK